MTQTATGIYQTHPHPEGFTPTAAEFEALEREGVLLLRQVLKPDVFRPLLRDLGMRVCLLEKQHGLPVGLPEGDVHQLSQRILQLEAKAPGSQSLLYDAMNHSPALHHLAGDPALLACVTPFLSDAVEIHPRKILLMSLPRQTWHLAGWHQDYYYNQGPASTLTLYLPLQPTDAQNGSLLFAPGEHHRGPLPHGEWDPKLGTKWHHLSQATVASFSRVVSSQVQVGDVLLFNSLVPHCARLNQSDTIRFVINLRYRDLSAPHYLADGWRVRENQVAQAAMARKPPVQTLKASGLKDRIGLF